MHYFLMYLWKMIYWISGIVIFVGLLIVGMDISKMFIASSFLQLLMAIAIWIVGSFIVLKPLSILDRFVEGKVSLDKEARLYFNMFVTFVLISVSIFFASIYTFDMWLGLIDDPHVTLDDYFTIIFPLVLVAASMASLMGSFKLYKKYEEIVTGKETL